MPNLEVKIQKTKLAKSLEKTLNIKWELNQQFPYDAGFDFDYKYDPIMINDSRANDIKNINISYTFLDSENG